jgi:late competence protein required for DNA uptake (superfamily II DNA/RNA helicase)
MILTREIEIKINESNYQYYDDLGYDVVIGEIIKIPIELMSKGSHYKIKCKCDGCGIEKEVIFKNYVKYDNNFGEYYCRKCSEVKRKETLRKNFGVDYPIQNKKVLNKMKNTLIEKYGVDNISKRDKQNEIS